MGHKQKSRGPRIPNEVRQLIISQAIHDSKTMPRRALAVRLQELIERMGEISPTEDTLARMISAARNKQPSELEKPWCIGACAYYCIPHDMIPVLNKIQRLKAECTDPNSASNQLTVREARWIARLYHAIEPQIGKIVNTDGNNLLWLDFIANSYVQRERVSEQMNEPYPETTDLDRLYFYDEDFFSENALISWWDSLLPDQRQTVIDFLEKERTITHRDMQQHKKRPLSSEETNMIDAAFDSLEKGGLVTLYEFINQSPLSREYGIKNIMVEVLFKIAYSGGIK